MKRCAGKTIVVLGMMSKMPVAGVVWQTLHYLVGFQRLGYEVYYVEAHARTPSMFIKQAGDDGALGAASFIAGALSRFDLGDRWAYQALHSDGRCYGLSEGQLDELYRSAAVLINLHGGTRPRPEHAATGRLIYLETDPVALQIEIAQGCLETLEFLAPHCAYFTFGENYGRPDCRLPVAEQFPFRPTRQPVVLDFWSVPAVPGSAFTTIGNWRQPWRELIYQGEVYHWSKHFEFIKFLNLPLHTDQIFELALSSLTDEDRQLLERQGWRIRPAQSISDDPDCYRDYVTQSRGEFTVAKDQNVRLLSGWFSDRSATYLAAGRPVITQETGFSNFLPTGEGLFGFSTLEGALAAVEAINSDYPRHSRKATALANDYFRHDVVLKRLLADVGLSGR